MKRTVILRASDNPVRYACMAAELLVHYGHEIIPMGMRKGMVANKCILPLFERPPVEQVHTVILHINPAHQLPFLDYILDLKPRRLIFNQGTENPQLEERSRKAGVETVHGCTLVMLRTGQY